MSRSYYILISTFCAALLMSCTLLVKNSDLYATFNDYSSKLNTANTYSDTEIKNLFQHFSPRYQTEVLNGREPSIETIKHLITNYFSIPLELKSTLSHYESHEQNSSCLLINAVNNKNERVSLYVAYVNQNHWLIDNFNVEYLGENEAYLKTPICDVDSLMKKRMEAWK